MDTMVEWITQLLRRQCSSSGEGPPLDAAILDVGTGNGVLPLELARLGFTNVTGKEASLKLPPYVACCREQGALGPAALLWGACIFVQTAEACTVTSRHEG